MSSPVLNVFTQSDLEYLNNLPEVLEAKALLDSRKVVYFSITLTESLRATLEERLNLDLSTVSSIPLRWIKGDTPSHIDTGAFAFEHTYLVYVNDNKGSFVLGSESYPIQANTAFVFSEGISHKTEGTGLEPRLLWANSIQRTINIASLPAWTRGQNRWLPRESFLSGIWPWSMRISG